MRPGLLNTFFFWAMLLAGSAALAPCLVLPAWEERQAQLECLKAQAAYVETLKDRVQRAQNQIAHLQADPAYLLRLAQEDFGSSIKNLPKLETIHIAPGVPDHEPAPAPPVPAAQGNEDLLPELDSFIEAAQQRYPHATIFLDPQSRQYLMGFGGGLIAAAIVLLALLERPRLRVAAE
jgi:hypothetical protein